MHYDFAKLFFPADDDLFPYVPNFEGNAYKAMVNNRESGNDKGYIKLRHGLFEVASNHN